uniref:Uncharacterized protein n=1 Tax=Mycena chlorophos TaxID=658473 RepID=A0ABQ0LS81_MYCCL|nr:predicted protein [Mycena chlorophos]
MIYLVDVDVCAIDEAPGDAEGTELVGLVEVESQASPLTTTATSTSLGRPSRAARKTQTPRQRDATRTGSHSASSVSESSRRFATSRPASKFCRAAQTRRLGAFIGEGAGGLLPKLGWDLQDFNNFINRSETDTAWNGYQRRKKANEAAAAGQKRTADDDGGSSSRKKSRADDPDPNGYMMANPLSNNMYGRTDNPNLFNDLMRNGSNGSPIFNGASPTNAQPGAFAPPTQPGYQSSYLPGLPVDTNLPPLSFPNPPATQTPIQPQPQASTSQLNSDQAEDDDDPNKSEAYKLIHYHLDNYKRNTNYCLPSSLRPTLVQRTVPHESVIDRILHPELRDRMILLRGRFDLVDCLLDYRNAVTIHGDDVLAHTNWEISEKWLRQYSFLVDPATLNIVNRWRRERAEGELRLADLTSAENTPATT